MLDDHDPVLPVTVTYVAVANIHRLATPGCIYALTCGPSLGFTLSGDLHLQSNTL
jgi:hypothetical protein